MSRSHELFQQAQMILTYRKDEIEPQVYPHTIAFNCLPHIDVFLENGYTKEEIDFFNILYFFNPYFVVLVLILVSFFWN